jgi:anaerobic selenocysteine-containing dehydrogenase
VPNYEPAGSSARYPLAMISPPARNFPQLQLRQRDQPAQHRRRARAGDPCCDAAARGIASGAVVRVFNDRGNTAARPKCPNARAPGVVNGLGIWWRKLGLDGTNVNQLTSQKLTDLGRGPVFYDCLVEVAGLPKPA